MSAVIIEHVNIADLPETWRAKLPVPTAAQVTVRIESEAPAVAPIAASAAAFVTSDPLPSACRRCKKVWLCAAQPHALIE